MRKEATTQVIHYESRGSDRVLDLDQVDLQALGDESLLWVDLTGNGGDEQPVLDRLGPAFAEPLRDWAQGSNPEIKKFGDVYRVRVAAVSSSSAGNDVRGDVLTLVASGNVVLTLHTASLPFVDALRERESSGSDVGTLNADSFVASLLDWQLSSYYEAVADYELAVERLELALLESRHHGCLDELSRLRRWASRLRRMLAPHHVVYAALARPDFRPSAGADVSHQFELLNQRFERAMDMVENARELVLGSFALFSSQTALQTNDRMRILTFVTVITGALATVVGTLGMNFEARIFQSRDLGFWLAVIGLGGMTIAALILGRWRKWY